MLKDTIPGPLPATKFPGRTCSARRADGQNRVTGQKTGKSFHCCTFPEECAILRVKAKESEQTALPFLFRKILSCVWIAEYPAQASGRKARA